MGRDARHTRLVRLALPSGRRMLSFLRKLFGLSSPKDLATPRSGRVAGSNRYGIDEIVRRLGVSEAELRSLDISYSNFTIPKRSGGTRTILAPNPAVKSIQRRILRCLLRPLRSHPCATGFERGHSIVTNARPHVGQEVVIKLDIRDFFSNTRSDRVAGFFSLKGWNDEAVELLTRICTYEGALPQGAPTSPRLSNLVNRRMDERLAPLAEIHGMSYSRYADDITLSGPARVPYLTRNPKTLGRDTNPLTRANMMIYLVKKILSAYGYTLHTTKKLRIARRHDRQIVTGLVVNEKVQLPRATRRRLRAIRHRLAKTGQATLTREQLAGWDALEQMIAKPA